MFRDTKLKPRNEITTERMALHIADLFLDFDEELHKRIVKLIIDYFLDKKGV